MPILFRSNLQREGERKSVYMRVRESVLCVRVCVRARSAHALQMYGHFWSESFHHAFKVW